MPEPTAFIADKSDLPLSGPALAGLLKAVLEKGKSFRFRAKGFSMAPFIADGDVLTVAPRGRKTLRPGDVVAFTHPETGRLVIHRIIGRHGKRFVAQGDNAPYPDGAIPEDSILGPVTRVERNGKNCSLGLGPERVLISFLTRRGLLTRTILSLWKTKRFFFRRRTGG